MFDTEFIKSLPALGIGGVLGGLIFMFYRKDVKQFTELWRNQTDMLITVIKENTASNTKLITLIEGMNEPVITVAQVEAIVVKQIEAARVNQGSRRAGV